tara:strand:- start:5058 stop:5546 length:489 start_codon:yes stop_codon:yes gene_type:complete
MANPQFSDEPRTIEPSSNKFRILIVVGFALILLVAILYIPLFNSWQERQSHEAIRGQYQGAVYSIPIDNTEIPMELAWAGPQLAIVLPQDQIPPEEISIEIEGSFGNEVLGWNEEYSVYGPTQARMDPSKHYKVEIIITADDKTLWEGKKWAWGVHSHEHHH